jgi:hypothetical protein
MHIAIGIGGEVTGTPMSPPDIVDEVVRAEADGFGAAPHPGQLAGLATAIRA